VDVDDKRNDYDLRRAFSLRRIDAKASAIGGSKWPGFESDLMSQGRPASAPNGN